MGPSLGLARLIKPNPTDDFERIFLRQSFRSNYCAVYSTGMLLSLLGIPTTRAEALSLFDLRRSNPTYVGASHLEIGKALARLALIKHWRWESQKRFEFAVVLRSVRAQLDSNPQPTLLSFGAIHKNGRWRCLHVVVVTRVTEEVIEGIDPLGPTPAGNNGNVWFKRGDSPTQIRVIGNSYSINPSSQTSVLRWNCRGW
jgi:hypothetical protein